MTTDRSGSSTGTHAAWYEAENFKEPGRIYNGSGQLIYRGAVMGYSRPVPSIRLKAQRRGLQDYEYFRLLGRDVAAPSAKPPCWTRIWKNNTGRLGGGAYRGRAAVEPEAVRRQLTL